MVTDLQDWYAWVETVLSRISTLDHGAFLGLPAAPNSGDCYLAEDTGQLFVCFVAGRWVDITAAYLLLAGGVMIGAIDMGANQINNLADPTVAQDAATMAYVQAYAAALVHAGRHETGGADEISVAGLLGLLAADQHVIDAEVLLVAAALVHAARHENGGADEISIAGLDGESVELAAHKIVFGNHSARHEDTGADEISVAGLAGLLAADQHVLDAEVLLVAAALVHAGRHETGGADEISVAGLLGLLAADQHVIDAEVVAVALALAGGTMAGNIIMGGNKVTGLGAPAAQDDALRYNRAEIRNAEIAAGAAIAYAKLNLAASIVMADFAAAIQNAANGIVVLDASADVPDAQIPSLNASKITAGRFGVARLPDVTDEYILVGTGTDMEERAIPVTRTESWLHTELAEDGIVTAVLATVADFQTTPAAGTFSANPEKVNDNDTGNYAMADTIGQYAEVDFGKPVVIRRYRHYGNTNQNADGEWKIEYWDLATDAWADFATGIATRALASWSGFVTETAKITTKIRLTCVLVDTGWADNSMMPELEVIY